MKSEIFIIHFSPLELYPPIQNLVRVLENDERVPLLTLVSTKSKSTFVNEFKSNSIKVKLLRVGKSSGKLKAVIRYWNYFLFFTTSTILLMCKRPSKVLYFETISVWPVYIYKRFINTKCSVLIHYHEYTTPTEYAKGSLLVRYFYNCEKWIFPLAIWVSHTNYTRLRMFVSDITPITISNLQVVPNYPPSNWYNRASVDVKYPIRIVYVGALSLSSMYSVEFANWVVSQNGNVTWDVFSINYVEGVDSFLKGLNSRFITVHSGVDYEQLPGLLKNYDIGVVLYKGVLPNHIFSVSNKLFEYLVCGLDVWFPSVIEGSLSYCTSTTYPQVHSFDFSDLNCISLDEVIDRSHKEFSKPVFFCEDALKVMTEELLK
jgi:hypothetical protein